MRNRKRSLFLVIVGLALLLSFNRQVYSEAPGVDGGASLFKALPSEYVQFDGNTIADWLANDGSVVTQRKTGSSGMEWPKGSTKTIDYASGIWLCGIDNEGAIRTACAEYASEYNPGIINADGTAADKEDARFRIYKINSDGTGDWDDWPFDLGAPALKKVDGTDSLDASGNKIPELLGDQTLWWVMNDATAATHANAFSTKPMGVEVGVTVFGFNSANPLGSTMFLRFRIENKSTITYDSCYVAFWDDPDLGDASDDLVGCDTTLSLGYCYNGGPVDATYGTTPPAIGMDFFQGPEVPPGSGNYLPMTSFVYYWNGAPDPYGDPEDAIQMYNFMNGYANDGSSYTDDAGNASKFVFNGDPATGSGWLDSEPGDRRFLMASGPFTLAPGDIQVIVGAKIIAPGTDNKSSVSALRFFDSYAQNAFDNKFHLPQPPAPDVLAIGQNQKIVLDWQDEADKYKTIESYEFSGYTFEGYNVYQGESETGPWKRIATFDIDDDFGIVFDNNYDAASGMVLNQPVAFGANTGITRNLSLDADKVTGTPLYNYKKYYYSVTSYAVNPDVSPKVVESGQKVIVAVPKGQVLGVKLNAAADDIIDLQHIAGVGDGFAKALIVDPAALTGHTYQVTFTEAEGGFEWSVTDKTLNQVVLANQTNQTNDEDYAIVDGFKLYVSGPAPGMKDWDIPQGTRRWTWAGGSNTWGLEGFSGAMGWWQPATWWGSGYLYPAANLKNVLLVLAKVDENGNFDVNDPNVSYAYRWLRRASAEPAKPEFAEFITNPGAGYAYQGFAKGVPLAAFDVEDPANPRRLAVGHFENNVPEGMVDGKYWPPDYTVGDNSVVREQLYIFDVDYSETPNPAFEDEITSLDLPIMWSIVAERRGNVPFSPDGTGEDQFLIIANHINSSRDVYEFTTPAPSEGTQVAKNQLAKLNVVPNPYLGWNPAERTPTTRIMRFTNMPGSKATIRIFDLAGNLVRVIDDAARQAQGSLNTAYAEWDLRNAADVPVASGMYLAHIEIEGVGSKVIKIAVINREERLLYF
jgi:hypothetical protein